MLSAYRVGRRQRLRPRGCQVVTGAAPQLHPRGSPPPLVALLLAFHSLLMAASRSPLAAQQGRYPGRGPNPLRALWCPLPSPLPPAVIAPLPARHLAATPRSRRPKLVHRQLPQDRRVAFDERRPFSLEICHRSRAHRLPPRQGPPLARGEASNQPASRLRAQETKGLATGKRRTAEPVPRLRRVWRLSTGRPEATTARKTGRRRKYAESPQLLRGNKSQPSR